MIFSDAAISGGYGSIADDTGFGRAPLRNQMEILVYT
jgi:hypothetical protein